MFFSKENAETSSKRQAITTACQEWNLLELVDLANSKGGLLDDTLRATACKFGIPAERSRAKIVLRAALVGLQ